MMYKVIQWATGTVGRHATRAVLELPDLELVGAYVYCEQKHGLDVGEICGIGPIGVKATTRRDEILQMDADCVLYMAQGEMNPFGVVDDICEILESGKNVVSTALTALIYPKSMGEETANRIQASCEKGGTSFHGTGVEPGWAAEVLPLTMSPLFKKIDSILVQEVIDYSTYNQPGMLFDIMGYGKQVGEPCLMDEPELMEPTFMAPLMMVAKGLNAEIQSYRFHREVATADFAFDILAGRVEANTVAAQRFGLTAVINGRDVLTVQHITRLHPDVAPDWPKDRGWSVTVKGTPSMLLQAKVATGGEDEVDQACLATAMHAVHAISFVCDASPGIKTFLDLPIVTGRNIIS